MDSEEDCGRIYLFTNPAMPGLVKLGKTTNSVEQRMKELYAPTGIPAPFECAYSCKVKKEKLSKIERALHEAFAIYRLNPKREFFTIDVIDKAKGILSLFDKEIEDITNEVKEDIEKTLTEDDKIASEKVRDNLRKTRPNLNFLEMNIPVNSELIYAKDENVKAIVCGDKKVTYKGEEKSLTAVTKELLGVDNVRPALYWSYKGKMLKEIYDETYVNE